MVSATEDIAKRRLELSFPFGLPRRLIAPHAPLWRYFAVWGLCGRGSVQTRLDLLLICPGKAP